MSYLRIESEFTTNIINLSLGVLLLGRNQVLKSITRSFLFWKVGWVSFSQEGHSQKLVPLSFQICCHWPLGSFYAQAPSRSLWSSILSHPHEPIYNPA